MKLAYVLGIVDLPSLVLGALSFRESVSTIRERIVDLKLVGRLGKRTPLWTWEAVRLYSRISFIYLFGTG